MVVQIDTDTGEEYEETEEEILAMDRYKAKMAEKRIKEDLPDFSTGFGVDGHKYDYPVIGRNSDGSYKTTSFDAIHCDDCPCGDPEKWY